MSKAAQAMPYSLLLSSSIMSDVNDFAGLPSSHTCPKTKAVY